MSMSWCGRTGARARGRRGRLAVGGWVLRTENQASSCLCWCWDRSCTVLREVNDACIHQPIAWCPPGPGGCPLQTAPAELSDSATPSTLPIHLNPRTLEWIEVEFSRVPLESTPTHSVIGGRTMAWR
jgi:hypothetical protein